MCLNRLINCSPANTCRTEGEEKKKKRKERNGRKNKKKKKEYNKKWQKLVWGNTVRHNFTAKPVIPIEDEKVILGSHCTEEGTPLMPSVWYTGGNRHL